MVRQDSRPVGDRKPAALGSVSISRGSLNTKPTRHADPVPILTGTGLFSIHSKLARIRFRPDFVGIGI